MNAICYLSKATRLKEREDLRQKKHDDDNKNSNNEQE